MNRWPVRLFAWHEEEYAAPAGELRFEVFVDEQHVPPEEELDALDATSTHAIVFDESEAAVATGRLILLEDNAARIGRVAVRKKFRCKGAGVAIVDALTDEARRKGVRTVILDSQDHALGFYEKLGFVAEGPEFLDAGIPHRRMTKAL